VLASISPSGSDANLKRREIGAIERAELIARRVGMVEARKQVEAPSPEISRQVGAKSTSERNPKGSGRKSGRIKQTARDLGVPEQRSADAPPPERKMECAARRATKRAHC